MNKERLLRLADKLEGKGAYEEIGPVPTKKFKMDDWVRGDEAKLMSAKHDKDGYLKEIPCGTAACACGWAAIDPWFRKRGFRLYTNGYSVVHPRFDGFGADEAVSKFFDLPPYGFRGLFVEDGTPKQVAKRIRKFVAQYES
jgi:hypothetical protein